uniref:F-box domain-containing protein n=1 Tax=Plectus sambesii TaxID=2011161 RepID=A0A914VDR5_9BILA
MSMTAHEAEVARLQAEIDRLGHMVTDFNERIVCGRLTGELPDNFLEQFSQLPDRPLEQVLRFLPAREVTQMRHVSRRFNHVIRKCSSTMPKKGSKGEVAFRVQHQGVLTVDWFDDSGKKFTRSMTTLTDDKVALPELLRFMRIDGLMYFGKGLSAVDKVLDQLSKAWLTIRPETVIFSSDFSQTSRESLRAFLVKVEPFVKHLLFQNASNIGSNLLSEDVIRAAGRLEGLMVMPVPWNSELPDLKIGDDMLLAIADADHVSSYFLVKGCLGITPNGIRTFVEKWMKKERPQVDANFNGFGWPLELCELTFDKCANVTPAAVEEACGDLLKKGIMVAVADASSVDDSEEMNDNRLCFIIHCLSSNRRLEIRFHIDIPPCSLVKDPRSDGMIDDKIDYNYEDNNDLDPEMDEDDIDDFDGYDAIDYDDDEDSYLD